MDARDGLHEGAVHGELVHPVGEGRRQRAELTDQIRAAEHPILQADAALAYLSGPGANASFRFSKLLVPLRLAMAAPVSGDTLTGE